MREPDAGSGAHGQHVLLDYTGFSGEPEAMGSWLLAAMARAIEGQPMSEVHRHLEVLGQTTASPLGFTSVILVDESHLTAHAYTDRGWLALDVFTCGASDTEAIADQLHESITWAWPAVQLARRVSVERFLHGVDATLTPPYP